MRFLAAFLVGICVFALSASAEDLAIVGAKVYPSPEAAPISDATVIMRNGKIVAVGPIADINPLPSDKIIDGSGKVVVAGLWNSHVHLISPAMTDPSANSPEALSGELETMLTRWGFTTVFDIGSASGAARSLRQMIETGSVRGPNILTVDAPFYPNDGVPIYVRDLLEGQTSFEIGSPAEAAKRAGQQLQSGADGVKLFAGSIVGGDIGVLPMPLDAARAMVGEAHKAGKPAFAHPTNVEGLEIAIESGVDILAHPTPDDASAWTSERLNRMHAHKMALIPTLTLWKVELQKENAPRDVVNRFVGEAEQQVRAYADEGGQILFGTDVGYTNAFDTTDEYRFMAEAGLTFPQILESLTTAPASRFAKPDKGAVNTGMDADLTVLNGDPSADITAFADVAYTIRAGEVIYEGQH